MKVLETKHQFFSMESTLIKLLVGLLVIVVLLLGYLYSIGFIGTEIGCIPSKGFTCQNSTLSGNLFNATIGQEIGKNWTNAYFLWVPKGQSLPFSSFNVLFCPPLGSNTIDGGVSCADTSDDIVFLGDSITAAGNWTSLFGISYIINAGIPGDRVYNIIDKSNVSRVNSVTSSKPQKIFLMLGINDLGDMDASGEGVPLYT